MNGFEHNTVKLADAAEFDKLVSGECLQEGGDIRFVTKSHATQEGRAAVCITFTVKLPDGTLARAQAVTTARLFCLAAKMMEQRHGTEFNG